MIQIDDKEYRNIQEQVQKNMCDIKALKFGLKIVGQVNNVPDLPEEASIGDAYLVGTSYPYYIYIKTANPKTYINMGTLQSDVEGPEGPQGVDGLPGKDGTIWFTGYGEPTHDMNPKIHDLYLDASNGNVYKLNEKLEWILLHTIRGPQGPLGNQGPKGDKGDKGDQGVQGPLGPTVKILGSVGTVSELPNPKLVPRNSAYIVGTNPKTVYAIQGIDTLEWVQIGGFTNVNFGTTPGTAFEGSEGKALEDHVDSLAIEVASNTTNIERKANYFTSVIKDAPSGITSIETFYKVFYDARTDTTRHYLIEGGTDQEKPNQSIIDALGGFPEGFLHKQHWALIVNMPISYSGGFYLDVQLQGSVGDDVFKRVIKAWNGGGVYASPWESHKTNATKKYVDSKLSSEVIWSGYQDGNFIPTSNPIVLEKVKKAKALIIQFATDNAGIGNSGAYNRDVVITKFTTNIKCWVSDSTIYLLTGKFSWNGETNEVQLASKIGARDLTKGSTTIGEKTVFHWQKITAIY